MTKSIQDIKLLLASIHDKNDQRLFELQQDERKGVQQALQVWQKNYEKRMKRQEQFERMQVYEQTAYQQGYQWIAGIDEVGRGPLAGPVVAAAVILPKKMEDIGLDDSKKLSAKKRQEIEQLIRKHAVAIGVGVVSSERIDEINIYQATKEAMVQAVCNLKINPDYLLLDAMQIDVQLPQQSIIKGDASSISIAAASIIAKQVRDRMMEEYAIIYPDYGFEHNAGYGTKEHLEGLKKVGPCAIHRKTFAPVSDYNS